MNCPAIAGRTACYRGWIAPDPGEIAAMPRRDRAPDRGVWRLAGDEFAARWGYGARMTEPASPRAALGPLAKLIASDQIRVAEADPRTVPAGVGLFPREAIAIAKAVQSRREQFTAGRILARRALAELGHPEVELPSAKDRVPEWPPGVVGTITHTHGWCAAAVARASDVAALGADVEAATPLDPGLWDRVCRPEERAFLQELPTDRAGLLAKAIFSAKESAYKALYPRVRTFLDFQGMSITIEDRGTDQAVWRAELQTDWGELQRGLGLGPGKLSLGPDWIVTVLAQ
jgi:4'-phosphopantetheinyl transferase EntD